MKKSCLFIGLLMAGILLSGCVQPTDNNGEPIVGNDADEHGCIGSAGYTWCEEKQKCIRPWEEECIIQQCAGEGENIYDMASKGPVSCCAGLVLESCESTCTPSITGKCVKQAGSTGLPNPASVYCEEQGGSLRIEEGETGQYGICTLLDGTECEEWAYYRGECPVEKPLWETAGEFCNSANVAGIFTCGNYVKVTSSLLGGGSTYYVLENGEWSAGIQCPVVGPDSMSTQCKELSTVENCIEKQCAVPKQGIEEMAEEFCSQPNVSAVFVCGEYAKVVSSLVGGGSTFYKLEDDESWGNEIMCPVVSPDSMSEECRLLIMGSNCIETEVC